MAKDFTNSTIDSLGAISTKIQYEEIANYFSEGGKVIEIAEFGSGNINQTFLVSLADAAEQHFILQKLNTRVFANPELVMSNMEIVCDRINRKLDAEKNRNFSWKMPRVLLNRDNLSYLRDNGGFFWRAISFIDNSLSFDTIQHLEHAREIGYGLGMFHHLVSDIPLNLLSDTLVGFHIAPSYLDNYDRVVANTKNKRSPENNYCRNFIESRRQFIPILENAKAAGILKLRPIHGDPKINNIMLDKTTKKAVAIIDLDTVKPGLIHYDLGDCLRSGCNRLGEETKDWEKVSFEPEIARSISQGYFSVAEQFLEDGEYQYIYDAIRLLSLELGLRFYTDYLQGNTYFKTDYAEHNRDRALVQFKLTESIELQEKTIRQIIGH